VNRPKPVQKNLAVFEGVSAMGKNATAKVNTVESAPVLTVVKAPRVSKYATITVKVATGLVFDAVGILQDAATSGRVEGTVFPFSAKTAKSGRVVVTIGKVSAGRPKMSDAEKAQAKANVKAYRALMSSNKTLAEKLLTMTPEKILAILATV
jgi:hypothetical protein